MSPSPQLARRFGFCVIFSGWARLKQNCPAMELAAMLRLTKNDVFLRF